MVVARTVDEAVRGSEDRGSDVRGPPLVRTCPLGTTTPARLLRRRRLLTARRANGVRGVGRPSGLPSEAQWSGHSVNLVEALRLTNRRKQP